MRPRPPNSRRALAAALILCLAASLPAAGQDRTSAPRLRLLFQPAWHDADDRLALRLAVANDGVEPLEGYRLQLAVYDRVGSRSALHDSYDGPDGFEIAVAPFSSRKVVEPGEQLRKTIATRVEDLLPAGEAQPAGVYPLAVSLLDADGIELLDTFTTHLIYYPAEPKPRLDLALVVPLVAPASRGPAGHFVPQGDDGLSALERGVGDGGWLDGVLDALDGIVERGAHVGLAVEPRLLEELADLSNGYTRVEDGEPEELPGGTSAAEGADATLEQITELLDTPGVQPLFTPYASPDLPALGRHLPEVSVDHTLDHIREGQDVISSVLDTEADLSWFLPPGERLDRPTLDQLLQIEPGIERTFFSERSLRPAPNPNAAGCPEPSPTFTCPVAVGSGDARTLGLMADAELQLRLDDLTRPGTQALELQRWLAETAMIREELPGVRGRVIHATFPPAWEPAPRLSGLLLRRLATAPWLRLRTPDEALEGPLAAEERELVTIAPRGVGEPEDDFYDDVERAATVVENFGQIEPPAALVRRLERDVLVAESRAWWPADVVRSEGYARSAEAEALGEMSKITLGGQESITMSSRRAPIQLTVFNRTGYEVTLNVELTSRWLTFDRGQVRETFGAKPTHPLEFEATALSSGSFLLEARIETPRSGYDIDTASIEIRSTELNQVALALTLGALLFLVLFFAFRGVRRRRARRNPRAT